MGTCSREATMVLHENNYIPGRGYIIGTYHGNHDGYPWPTDDSVLNTTGMWKSLDKCAMELKTDVATLREAIEEGKLVKDH